MDKQKMIIIAIGVLMNGAGLYVAGQTQRFTIGLLVGIIGFMLAATSMSGQPF